MLKIQQLKLPPQHTEEVLISAIEKLIKKKRTEFTWQIAKQSIDARKKDDVKLVYALHVNLNNPKDEKRFGLHKNIMLTNERCYQFKVSGTQPMQKRPVIIGSGPAGLFCALMLAEHGYFPILLERGGPAAERKRAVEQFWETGRLDPESNVQFGEGGAGTFSDGKLNTLVKDKSGRNRKVLELFAEHGAPQAILSQSKPHIGTDILIKVIENMRQRLVDAGGEVRFYSKVTDLLVDDGELTGLVINGQETLAASQSVLAIGHSARDTFEMLRKRKVPMEPKSFAVGVRVEHPQEKINLAQYGKTYKDLLPPADYKVTAKASTGRNVYSFCMCPGGYVVNASSEPGQLAVNGMSYADRAGDNANSAIIVSVTPADFPGDDVLAGVAFQRELEQKAWELGKGKVPVQLFGDFCKNRTSTQIGGVAPNIKGSWTLANVREIFSKDLALSIAEGIQQFSAQIKGFDAEDTVLSGVESRTSSPVRICRDEQLQSEIRGLYPCGEGAGYAGGITSAAMDGIRIAEKIAALFLPPKSD